MVLMTYIPSLDTEYGTLDMERLPHQQSERSSAKYQRLPDTGQVEPRFWNRPLLLKLAIISAIVPIFILCLHTYTVLCGRDHRRNSFGIGDDGTNDPRDQYLLGVGKADITGPVVEINMMGYADPKQVGTGLRQRLYSRAFIVGSTLNPADRFIYLVLDTQSGDTAVRYGILSGLREMGPAYSLYGHSNVAVTGTHSHSGPGAWLNYLLPQITSKGFDKQSYQAIVNGCLLSIRRAHESLEPGYLSVGATKVQDASINRSLFAYLANPESERASYNISSVDDGSVDREMTLLRFQRAADGADIGVLTWFPTHGTSMLGNNTLISGDNKGVAADLFEKHVRTQRSKFFGSQFVAGFSQANMGDVSPNILGAWCEDGSGERCDFKTSTCSDGKSQQCHARGPCFRVKDNGAASCFEIGKRQYEAARKIYESLDQQHRIRGQTVRAAHAFHNMSYFEFTMQNGSTARTCPAALGYSFAAGTSDGPGAFDFTQHDSNSSNTSPLWTVVSGFLKEPNKEQIDCQKPKPVLLDVGEVDRPYQWTPNIVDIQTFRVGQLMIIVSPGEATTMAGRRWKNAVAETASQLFRDELDGEDPIVVLGGPANSYTHYISTEEEYGIQRYEGASTLYGPHTLEAYINRTLSFLPLLSNSQQSNSSHVSGPLPPDNSNRSLSFIPGVVYDGTPLFHKFGDVKFDVDRRSYRKGDRVTVLFVGANPRNNLRSEDTYAAVEYRRSPLNEWEVVRDDSDWDLLFAWKRTSEILGTSEVEVTWEIEEWTQLGEYRIRYRGDSRSVRGDIAEFAGASTSFWVN